MCLCACAFFVHLFVCGDLHITPRIHLFCASSRIDELICPYVMCVWFLVFSEGQTAACWCVDQTSGMYNTQKLAIHMLSHNGADTSSDSIVLGHTQGQGQAAGLNMAE